MTIGNEVNKNINKPWVEVNGKLYAPDYFTARAKWEFENGVRIMRYIGRGGKHLTYKC